MKKLLLLGFSVVLFTACYDDSSIQVKNMLPKAVILNVEWGSIPIAGQVFPGQTSEKRIIPYQSSYYDVELPASHVLKFYIELNGDMIYLTTKEAYRLGKEEDILIVVDSATKIVNPLVESQE